MTTLTYPSPTPSRLGLLLRLMLRWMALLRHRRPRAGVCGGDELRGMDDRALADLGIGRSEIPAVLACPGRHRRS